MGATGAFYSVPLNYQFHRRPLHFHYLHQPPFLVPVTTFTRHQIIKLYCPRSSGSRLLLNPPRAVLSSQSRGESGSSEVDADLRSVLELATDSELYELQRILFGPSYFSPLLKSATKRAEFDYFMIGEDLEEREEFLSMLESRFLYLAADARSTLRGRRPSYREVLLGVREKLSIRCSAKLSAEDLEAEIFLHLLQEYSSSKESLDASDGHGSLEFGLSKWKVQAAAGIKAGAEGVRSIILKGGGVLTLGKIYSELARRFSGKMLLEAANYQISREVLKKGGEVAALNLESRLAMLAAKKGLAGAASRYFGLRSMMTFLGPILWGTLLADVVIQMLGTDYARIVRAIYAFAQDLSPRLAFGASFAFLGICGRLKDLSPRLGFGASFAFSGICGRLKVAGLWFGST